MQNNNKFHFKHSLGQNFLKDDELLINILNDAKVDENSNVLEIGAGAGALTTKLCERAKNGHVLSVEIDRSLEPILSKKLNQYNNAKLVFADILSVDKADIINEFKNENFKVVANLPYYITTPILEYLLDSNFNITDITVMVQLEVAKRLSAKPGTKDYGAITPILEMYGEPMITRVVDKTMFTPRPKVDSAILHIEINKKDVKNIKHVSSVIKKCFAMRRKTLQNNLCVGFNLSKEESAQIISKLGFNQQVRAEMLGLEQFLKLAEILK